jgi:hypothetical protein
VKQRVQNAKGLSLAASHLLPGAHRPDDESGNIDWFVDYQDAGLVRFRID